MRAPDLRWRYARRSQRQRSEYHRRHRSLHVTRRQPVHTSGANLGPSGSECHKGRASAHRFGVEVPVENEGWACAFATDACDQIWAFWVGGKHLTPPKSKLLHPLAQHRGDPAFVGVRGELAVDGNQLENQVDQSGAMSLEEGVHRYTTTSSRG